ncbi:MAG: SRPBCC domain-containing protein [Alphaproteobacteria bacterium]
MSITPIDARLDLVLKRELAVPVNLVWTSALLPGYRPKPPLAVDNGSCENIVFTCVVTLKETTGGTAYIAHVMHSTPDQTKAHEEMGFYEGWGTTITQLEELVGNRNRRDLWRQERRAMTRKRYPVVWRMSCRKI